MKLNLIWSNKKYFFGRKTNFKCCSEVVVGVVIWLWRDSVVTVCWNEVVVVKGIINSWKHTCTYFKCCEAFCLVLCSAIFDSICMERTWIREGAFNMEKGVWRCLWMLKFWVCGFVGLWKIGGVILAMKLRAWLHEMGLLALRRCRHLRSTQKNQLCNYMTTKPARLTGITAPWCRDPGLKCCNYSRLPGNLANKPSEKQDRG